MLFTLSIIKMTQKQWIEENRERKTFHKKQRSPNRQRVSVTSEADYWRRKYEDDIGNSASSVTLTEKDHNDDVNSLRSGGGQSTSRELDLEENYRSVPNFVAGPKKRTPDWLYIFVMLHHDI